MGTRGKQTGRLAGEKGYTVIGWDKTRKAGGALAFPPYGPTVLKSLEQNPCAKVYLPQKKPGMAGSLARLLHSAEFA